ncbi:dehydrogenase/reductase SDR family member 12 isoform X2 [Bos indicus x Bos taurus]|uniref:Dehydrogenase/reductase 12 n=1 Tax=Bos taurus TaxID=9913 RepID=A0AAA9TC59_BOVIN|nr:dehydrogenase/reductase SDR family member 12 isoform X2 [Bos indicus x Bos taurus]
MLLYRSAAWFAKGLREYTKSGYESASKDFVPDDLEVQVPGRAFMVTGGNSGIGKATAMEIAKRGGTVHLVCRDHSRAEGAKAEIIRESGNQNIFLHIVDLSLPKSVWKFVENFKQEHTLNVLINNAGCMVNKRELTEDGLEKNFATNTLGVYVLTTALIPVLEKEHDPRVITVSSGGMLVQKLNTDDPQSERTAFDGTMVYAQNKRQQVVLTERWARAHPAIHFSCMHPGWVDTPGHHPDGPHINLCAGRVCAPRSPPESSIWVRVRSAICGPQVTGPRLGFSEAADWASVSRGRAGEGPEPTDTRPPRVV